MEFLVFPWLLKAFPSLVVYYQPSYSQVHVALCMRRCLIFKTKKRHPFSVFLACPEKSVVTLALNLVIFTVWPVEGNEEPR